MVGCFDWFLLLFPKVVILQVFYIYIHVQFGVKNFSDFYCNLSIKYLLSACLTCLVHWTGLVCDKCQSTLVCDKCQSSLVCDKCQSTLVCDKCQSTLVCGKCRSTLVCDKCQSTLVCDKCQSTLVCDKCQSTLECDKWQSTLVCDKWQSTLVCDKCQSTLECDKYQSTLVCDKCQSTLVCDKWQSTLVCDKCQSTLVCDKCQSTRRTPSLDKISKFIHMFIKLVVWVPECFILQKYQPTNAQECEYYIDNLMIHSPQTSSKIKRLVHDSTTFNNWLVATYNVLLLLGSLCCQVHVIHTIKS